MASECREQLWLLVPCWERMDLANSSGPSGRSRACTARRSEPPTRSVGSRRRGAALVAGRRRPARTRSSKRWWNLRKSVHESAGETLPEVRGGRDESPIGGSGNSAPSKLRWPTLCGSAGSTPALSAQQRGSEQISARRRRRQTVAEAHRKQNVLNQSVMWM